MTCQAEPNVADTATTLATSDGTEQQTDALNRPYQGLLVVPGIWRTLQNFSSGSVCLALASHHYDEDDYVRDYDNFLKLKTDPIGQPEE